MNFDKDELARVLVQHQKSYELYLWLNKRFREGHPPFKDLSESIHEYEAAKKWLQRNNPAFPAAIRLAADEFESVAHLFVSFIHTSFQVIKESISSTHGCGPQCGYCGHWLVGVHLGKRSITNKDKADADKIKRVYLRQLNTHMTDDQITAMFKQDKDFAHATAVAAYGHELIRRSKFQSQGGGSLALWKEIQPPDTRPLWKRRKKRPKFDLSAKSFLEAEKKVKSVLGNL
jgi:hypothetical protein